MGNFRRRLQYLPHAKTVQTKFWRVTRKQQRISTSISRWFFHPSIYQKFAELNKKSKNKRKLSSKEASELVGSLLESPEAEVNENNTGPEYCSPSKKVKGDFFAARPLELTQSKVSSSVLDYIMGEMWPLYTAEKPLFKYLMAVLAPYAKVPGRKALAVQIETKFLEVQKDMVCDFELTDSLSLTPNTWCTNNKTTWEWLHNCLTRIWILMLCLPKILLKSPPK